MTIFTTTKPSRSRDDFKIAKSSRYWTYQPRQLASAGANWGGHQKNVNKPQKMELAKTKLFTNHPPREVTLTDAQPGWVPKSRRLILPLATL